MTKFIQAPEFFVVSAIGTSETQITLSNFKTISGDLITQAMIGGVSDYIPMTLSPRTEREEQVLAKVNSVSGSNVILDIIRAINPVAPYDNGGGIAQAHNVNDTAVISNNPALFNKLTAKDNDETVTANWTFDGDNMYSGNNVHNGTETFTDAVDTTATTLDIADATTDTQPYTKGQTDTLLDDKADDDVVVKLTGNQTVAGVKTFSSSPVIPSASGATDAVNKGQMESYIAENSSDVKASDTAFGTTKLDVPADDVDEPLALTATADRVNFISGITGMVIPYAGSSAPTGFLLCDGSAVSRNTYTTLFALISTTYGVGDGSTTFNLPNLKGRVPVGFDSAQTEFDTLGETGGAKTHTLTTAQMPTHNHNVTYPTWSGSTSGSGNLSDFAVSKGINTFLGNANSPYGMTNTGGGEAHNNLQPYITLNYIIKT